LASYCAPADHWQVDGYGISRVANEHPAPTVVKITGRKCWYVPDVRRATDSAARSFEKRQAGMRYGA
jgi:hypothetical protein